MWHSQTPISPSKYNSQSSLVSFGSFPNLSEYKKTDDIEGPSSVELTDLNSHVSFGEPKTPIEKDSFYKYYWYNSGFLAEFIKTTEFIILVGIFEYFFFISIVDKFKIANSKTILCDVAKFTKKHKSYYLFVGSSIGHCEISNHQQQTCRNKNPNM